MFNALARILTAILLAGILVERLTFSSPDQAEPFHARVSHLVEQIPSVFAGWVGKSMPVPEPAQALLRPTAILAREYTDTARSLVADLVVVHCRDTRDLAGHYPMRCYPSSGWEVVGDPVGVSVTVNGVEVPLSRYEFRKHSFDSETSKVIYGTFLLPGKGAVASMQEVYRNASSYRSRVYGATQIQVILPGEFPRGEEIGVVGEMIEQVLPLVGEVQMQRVGAKP